MTSPEVKGWCPNSWHPMMAGDGLLMRVKPRLGRLTRTQVLGLCEAASAHGNALIDVTARANLQLRGVRESGWQVLLDRLQALDLVDGDPMIEQRRNVLIAPDWRAGDDNQRIAGALLNRLDELPDLPGKAGFVIDAGQTCILGGDAGDFRIERGGDGHLILRADGRATGVTVAAGQEVDTLIALAHWFAASGGAEAGRMARHTVPLPEWACGDIVPAPSAARIVPGVHDLGEAYGLPFGRIEARILTGAMKSSSAAAVRITPWRVLLVEGAPAVNTAGLLSDPADPLLHVDACPGAPCCPQATVETRDLARRLAPHVTGRLHVSGCAKGCAHPRPADVTLTGRDGLFDLSLNARAGGSAVRSALGPADILAHFGTA
ncbi:cobalamin biosynthesis protein CobG [Sphingobium sp. CR2-8]|uniref:cobalamin biosynthesis protein CobG n=1 Tax=Sphingobium sp. CR2-8 TaxID=1306534 RepID=UPI002DBD4084|nr:cobalamin biosynthesis protein CobG [Sphingobium sp. CR2-8]MEC3909071.1 cobalamin biosynthesis protein CobG [Sphingobium sp. CR2-8]